MHKIADYIPMKTKKNIIDIYYMLKKRLDLKKCKEIVLGDWSYGTNY